MAYMHAVGPGDAPAAAFDEMATSVGVQVWVVIVECLQAAVACHDATPFAFGQPPVAAGCTAAPASTLRQLACNAADFQQRTLWTAARLSAQRDNLRGVVRTNGITWRARIHCRV